MRRCACSRCGVLLEYESLPTTCSKCGCRIERVLGEDLTVRDLARVAADVPGVVVSLTLLLCGRPPQVNVLLEVDREVVGGCLLGPDGSDCAADEIAAWLASSRAELAGRFLVPPGEVGHA